jgi:phage/plasmid-like protein (TIGR03299 family)
VSRESIEWLNTMTRIGDTDQRGNAWHYRAGSTNHFPGAVPVEEVRKLILPYEPIEQPIYVKVPISEDEEIFHGYDKATDSYYRFEKVDRFKAIAAKDKPGFVHAVPSGEYQIHPYEEWLVRNVQNLLDDEVHISSAGLLDNGAIAWVEISISETQTIADFPYRPHLLASTSVNGKYKTTYGRKVQATVCDNTLAIADAERGQRISFKHTKNSVAHIADAREALGLILATSDDFQQEVNKLLDWKVSSKDFSKFLDLAVPLTSIDGDPLQGAPLTRRENKREKMAGMWRNDERVAPWAGTAFGVLSLTNTFFHHERGAKSATLVPERNMLAAISGETAKQDIETLELLAKATV